MKYEIHPDYLKYKAFLLTSINHFDTQGKPFGNQKRNTLKVFQVDGLTLNIKSFKVPNIFNQIAYKFLRKSKAQRSFEYACKLQNLKVGTPQPVAYFENASFWLFKKSFYVSEQLECDLTYRDLVHNFSYPDFETILREFTRFTYSLHEKGVIFLDHSPGNTLIKKEKSGYSFYLVDLNRMQFGKPDFETRMKNFARLSKHKHMVEIMSDEYAKCIAANRDKVFERMWFYVQDFQKKHLRKQALKKKIKR